MCKQIGSVSLLHSVLRFFALRDVTPESALEYPTVCVFVDCRALIELLQLVRIDVC
jgi:hypothetical protein